MYTFSSLFLSFMVLFLLLSQKAVTDEDADGTKKHHDMGIIGAIVDNSTRVGKEEKVAMEMAIEDVCKFKNQSLVLHIKNCSREHPFQAALTAKELISREQARAILGPRTWEESSLVAEIGSQSQIPILSLADTAPKWAAEKWPFLVQASPNQNMQMEAVAAIIQSFEWHRVSVIYEDIDSVANGVIPSLSLALREVGAEISDFVAVSPFVSSSISQELERLKMGQCRVFVVHLSSPLAAHLFEMAKRMNMMEKDYVWIVTDTITSLVHSLSPTTISTMQGVLGVKGYFNESGDRYQDFYNRFRKRFGLEYPKEDSFEPGVFAVQAYDALWAIAQAILDEKSNNIEEQNLIDKIMHTNFEGLIGNNVRFMDRKLAPPVQQSYQIINVIGRSYRELGYWTEKRGFSETIDEKSTNYNTSMRILGQVNWPGGPSYTPRGWTPSTNASALRIGVPTCSTFKQFVKFVDEGDDHSDRKNAPFTGFSIDVFKATLKNLPYDLPHRLIPFNGSYDDLVEQVHLKVFDAVVGDVAIVSNRFRHAEFTHPYTEAGLVMVVPVRSNTSNREWLFVMPFTKPMWVLIVVINVYNGFVVWLIERNHCPELKGSVLDQIGTLLWLAFTTLFSLHGERLHSNLSRMAMVIWLFVALVITQSYSANLTSILTVQQLEPTVADIQSLQNSNAMVGYCRGSFVEKYLDQVLKFKPQNLRKFTTPEEYAEALISREIAAAFLEVPVAKLFLAKYCKSFITIGPTYKVGGFGFAFPRGSPLLPDVSEALIKASEKGTLLELEKAMTAAEHCIEPDLDEKTYRLSPNSFWVLFVITGGTSTISLAIYFIHHHFKLDDHSMFGHRAIWRLMLVVVRYWGYRKKRFSRRVSDGEIPTTSSNTTSSYFFL